MGNSSKVVPVGLVLLLVGGAATLWILPSSSPPADRVAPVAANRAPAAGAPGFEGKAPPSAPGEARPMQFAADAVAPPATAAAPAHAAPAPEKPSAPARITGRVLDETGRPVRGAAVTFLDDVAGMLIPREEGRKRLAEAPSAETGFDGRFAISAGVPLERDADVPDFVIDMRCRLVVRHPEFATLLHSCGDVAPGEFDSGDLSLEPGAWVVGRVVDTAGRTLAGADIWGRNTGEAGGRRAGRGRNSLAGGLLGGGVQSTLDAVTTGPDGRFVVRGLHPGAAELTARKEGLRLASVPELELEARLPRDVGDVVLEPGVSISGVVLDGEGAALPGAEVSVSSMTRLVVNRIEDLPRAQIGQEFGQRVVADAAGRFEVSGLAGGTYTVHVRADGYAPLSREDVPAGTSNLRLQPVRLGALLVTILDSKSGAAVEGARIKATPSGDGPGRYFGMNQALPVLSGAEALAAAGPQTAAPPAAAAYLVRDAGPDGTSLVIAAEHYATQEVAAPAVLSDEVLPFTVRLVPESMVAGRVIDERQQPVDGATVTLGKVSPEELSGEGGGFRDRFERRIRIGGEQGEPELNAETMSARTGADGRFEVRGAAAGDWNITASAPDRVPSEPVRITLAEGVPQPDLEIVLRTAGSIAGLVTEADGTPAADVEVVVEARAAAVPATAATDALEDRIGRQMSRMFGNRDGSRNGPRRVRTDTTGAYAVTNLAEGEYSVKISSGPRRGRNFGGAMVITVDGNESPPDDSTLTWTRVAAGAESRVNLVRPPRGVVIGHVTAGGQPAPNVSVSLRPQEREFFGGERSDTDAHGDFRFEDVEAGSYTVACQAPGAALEERAPVSLEAGQERRVDLAFSGSTLSGRVLDTGSNKGVAGVTIRVQPVQEDASGAPGGEPEMRFEMVTVTAGGGGPPSGMSMTLGGGRSEAAQTDEQGNFTVRYVKAGRYTLEATGAGYARSTLGPLVVHEGENQNDLLMGVTRGAVVEGLVVSGSTGDRLDKVPVRLESGNDAQMTVTQDGSYRFDGLQPGDYTVSVLGSGFMSDPIASKSVTIEKDGEVHKVDLTTKQG